jgi:hypothetical protein
MKLWLLEYTLQESDKSPRRSTVRARFIIDGPSPQKVLEYLKNDPCIDLGTDLVEAHSANDIIPYIYVIDATVTQDTPAMPVRSIKDQVTIQFAGQTNTYLEVIGWPVKSIVEAVAKGYYNKEHEKAMKELE